MIIKKKRKKKSNKKFFRKHEIKCYNVKKLIIMHEPLDQG